MNERDRLFIEQVKATLDYSWRGRGKEAYTAATVDGCLTLYRLCTDYAPDVAIDVGTAAGASAITLALALNRLGVGERNVVTIGGRLGDWYKFALDRLGPIASTYGLDLWQVDAIESDFRDLHAQDYVVPGDRVFLFYDIHDRSATGFPSHHLTGEWLTRIENGLIVFHDVAKYEWKEERTIAKIGGTTLYGFGELEHIAEWLNERGGTMTVYDDALMGAFEIVEGNVA